MSITLCNPTATNVQLKLANKSCGCADVPTSMVINAHSEHKLTFTLGNTIAASGKQRLQLAYQSNLQQAPLVLQLDYHSVVPVYVREPAIYLDSELPGQFKVTLVTMLGEDHQPPKLSDNRYSLINYAPMNGIEKTGIRRYEATIGYPASEAGQHNLSFDYQYQGRNVQAAFPVTFRDPYVVQELHGKKSDSQPAARTLKVRRYDNKPFTLEHVKTSPHRECHFSTTASAIHQVSLANLPESGGTIPDLDVSIKINAPDSRLLTHRIYGTSFTINR